MPNIRIHKDARKLAPVMRPVSHEENTMNRILCLTILLALLVFTSGSAFSQSMYDEELSQLSGTLRALMVRAERNRPSDETGHLAIQKELFELSKKLHRLEEEAMATNAELLRKGNPPDRQLLLAASISKTLDLAVSLVSNYLDTRGTVFWSSAVGAAQPARTLQAAQR